MTNIEQKRVEQPSETDQKQTEKPLSSASTQTVGNQADSNQPTGNSAPAEKGNLSPAQPVASQWQPPKRKWFVTVILVLILMLGILMILRAWKLPPFRSAMVSTDNAYVRGQTTIISPQVTGYVTKVYVQDFDDVKAGQPLIQIDDRIYKQKVAAAEAGIGLQDSSLANYEQNRRSKEATLAARAADIANAQAQLEKAQADMARVNILVADGSLSLRERDQTRAALKQAQTGVTQAKAQYRIAQEDLKSTQVNKSGLKANVDNAHAQLGLAQIDLSNTVVRAPENGRLSEIAVKNGQLVNAGTQLMFLVPSRKWVVANFKEAQTANIRVGQPAWFTVDALNGAKISGTVEKISPAAGSEFSAIKPDTTTGNFVKVPQRIAVRIRIDNHNELFERLRPGMSVVVNIDTTRVRT
ncbi:HlyD family secretion protein [Snodgrassella communis]|jgi:multidrug resistance efflux pump|uniref:HlyD family secretion protein n=1 Tax=Snodgrassella communis TaxID=2946699 RepID=UPI000C1F412D|nr:HlyD family secretion protein [Snodgrassella communis]PIT20426.1 secretion protein HlyD [Snodgrassella communis]